MPSHQPYPNSFFGRWVSAKFLAFDLHNLISEVKQDLYARTDYRAKHNALGLVSYHSAPTVGYWEFAD